MSKKILIVVLAAAMLVVFTTSVFAQLGAGWYDIYSNVRMRADAEIWDDLAVADQLSAADLTLSDDLVVVDLITAADLTLSDDLVVGDDSTLGGFLKMTPQTLIEVANSGTFTPTGSYQKIQSDTSGDAGTNITGVAVGSATTLTGTVVIVTNVNTPTIQIADTGNNMLTGNITLGQYDSLMLLSDGTNWIMLGTANN